MCTACRTPCTLCTPCVGIPLLMRLPSSTKKTLAGDAQLLLLDQATEAIDPRGGPSGQKVSLARHLDQPDSFQGCGMFGTRFAMELCNKDCKTGRLRKPLQPDRSVHMVEDLPGKVRLGIVPQRIATQYHGVGGLRNGNEGGFVNNPQRCIIQTKAGKHIVCTCAHNNTFKTASPPNDKYCTNWLEQCPLVLPLPLQ